MSHAQGADAVVAVQIRLPLPEVRRLDSIVAAMQAQNPHRVVMRGAIVRQAVAEFLARHVA
jgi:hypothetical protein